MICQVSYKAVKSYREGKQGNPEAKGPPEAKAKGLGLFGEFGVLVCCVYIYIYSLSFIFLSNRMAFTVYALRVRVRVCGVRLLLFNH